MNILSDNSVLPVPSRRIVEFEKLGYGMFIHWGLYSLLGRGEWVMYLESILVSEYSKLANEFKADKFSGRQIARIAKQSGMKYICITTRHHDGFSLYDTKGLSNYDALHCAAGKDLIKDFVSGCREEGIVPFFYHTMLDWYQESYKSDFKSYLQYLRDSIEVLCRNYGPVGGFWFDGMWDKSKAGQDWEEGKLYSLIRKYQPEAVITNNTGLEKRGTLGHSDIDVVTYERGRPEPLDRRGHEKYVAGEMCQTMNSHWGIGKGDFSYLSPKQVIEDLCACRKIGANFLLNVGLEAAGNIPEYETATFKRVGDWIKEYGGIIYNSKPSKITSSNGDFALEYNGKVYLFVYDTAIKGHSDVTLKSGHNTARIFSGFKKKVADVKFLNKSNPFEFDAREGKLTVVPLGWPYGTNQIVKVLEVSMEA